MPYLGNIPATQFAELKYQDFTGGTGTSFTLNDPVGTAQELEVFVNNVRQEPGVAYTVSGTALTMTGSIVATDDFYVVFQGKSTGTATHPAGQALTATDGTFNKVDVDNIRIDGNTISSTDTNGDITLDPDGTGDTIVASGNLGVGTSSPSQEIHGYSSGGDFSLRLESGSSTGTAYTYFKNADQEYQIGIRGSASDSFQIIDTTADAARIVMDTSGNVGIGTATTGFNSAGLPLVVGSGSGDTGMTIYSGTANNGSLHFADGTSGDDSLRGIITYDHTNNLMDFFTNASRAMRINSSGHILVGQTSVSTPGQGNTTEGGSFRGDGRVFLSANGAYSLGLNRSDTGELTNFSRQGVFRGSINVSTSGVAYNTTSDHRLKEAVVDMTDAIARVKQLAPKRFNFIDDPDDTTVDGFLAHEAQIVVPEAVTGTHNEVDDDGNAKYQQIDQSKLVPLLVGALQEAIAKIETLETKVAALEAGE